MGTWIVRLILLGLALGVVANLAGMILGVGDLIEASASAAWPPTAGKITQAEIDVLPQAKGSPEHAPRLSYTYAALGENRVGSRRAIGRDELLMSTKERAERIVALYPVGRGSPFTTTRSTPAAPC